MAALPSDDLVWSIVKKHNSFVRKGLNGAVFSAEPYNLYNLHCKRFSGSLIGGGSHGFLETVQTFH